MSRHSGMTTQAHHQAIDPARVQEAQTRIRVTDAQQQQAPVRQGGANAMQHIGLRARVEILQHIQKYHGIGGPEIDLANVTRLDVKIGMEREPRPPYCPVAPPDGDSDPASVTIPSVREPSVALSLGWSITM